MNLVGGRWLPIPGDTLRSAEPARPDVTVWAGSPVVSHVDAAVGAARASQRAWAAWPRERRFEALKAVAARFRRGESEMAALICRETGKAFWDAKAEAGLLAAKIDITLETSAHAGLGRVTESSFAMGATREARCLYRPHGVMAVVGPFNFPAHLPNGHIMPALAMGNAIVLKPSDKAPATGQLYAGFVHEALSEAGAPEGVFNCVQGGADVAQRLIRHDDVDGILFTGSWPVGRAILQANIDRPGRIVALEMGGNNPALVMPDADLKQAIMECVRAAFITTGQRCTCTRRLVVHEAVAERVIGAIVRAASALRVGDPAAESGGGAAVFMGPLVTRVARDGALAFQERLRAAGGEVLLAMRDPGLSCAGSNVAGYFITPGVVRVPRFTALGGMDGAAFDCGCDEELFGPLLRVSIVRSLDEGIEQANATRYGLAASIFTRDERAIDRFLHEVRAGCLNVNCGTAGASGKLPFGGLGLSGNHRPAGAFSFDYCAYPVASMVESGSAATPTPGMVFDDSWLS